MKSRSGHLGLIKTLAFMAAAGTALRPPHQTYSTSPAPKQTDDDFRRIREAEERRERKRQKREENRRRSMEGQKKT